MQTTVLGPWNGGLNLTSNRDLSVFLQPNELGEATNVIFSKEGFIQPRPGCMVMLNGPGNIYQHAVGNYRMDIIGNVPLPDGNVVAILQVRAENLTYLYKIYDKNHANFLFSVPNTVWFNHVLVHDGGVAGHRGVIFFAEQTGQTRYTENFNLPDGPWMPSTATGVPGSNGGMIVKSRLFLWKNDISKFMWSPATYIFDWSGDTSGPNGIDVYNYELIEPTGPKDGITTVQFVNNIFYIFKRMRTYTFTYQTMPVEDAYLQKINTELGAFAATMYRNSIVVVNNRGVFNIDVNKFIDLQPKLDLRFETPLDDTTYTSEEIFITDFNNDLLVGYKKSVGNNTKAYYYCMSGYTGAWSRWTYDYNTGDGSNVLASPGTRQYRSQSFNSVTQAMFFATFDHKKIVYIPWKPVDSTSYLEQYHTDSNITSVYYHDKHYFPYVNIKTKALIGDSNLNYKKVYRTYMRFYLSDLPHDLSSTTEGNWTVSVNFNDYRIGMDSSHETEQLVNFYPSSSDLPISPDQLATIQTKVFKRVHQIPIHQFRAKEFVFELTRTWGSISGTGTPGIENPDVDEPPKPVKARYFFQLSGVFFHHEDKARMNGKHSYAV